jgi:peptidoglycan/LPS O-acetylase OafA/YrhL
LAAEANRYLALDGLRGFAVLLVFCVHAAGNVAAVALGVDFERASYAALPGIGERALFWLFRSHHGVFLFFILSGFLIARMWWPQRKLSYARFAWRRTLRIYPAFLIAFAASLAFAWHSGTWTPPDWPRLAGNLFFLNGAPGSRVVPFNLVTWSLFYEMTFYLAFPLCALLPVRPVFVAIAGIALPIVAVASGGNVMILCWSLLFMGVALAAEEDRMRAAAARIPAAAIVVAYLAITTGAMVDAMPAAVGIVAFGAVALLVVAKSLETRNAIAWLLSRRPLRALGRVSYSFYLLHWMIVVLVARAVEGMGLPAATIVTLGAGFALSAVAASLSWWIAERPYFRRR